MRIYQKTEAGVADPFWQSPALIPVLLLLIKEHLAQGENQHCSSEKASLLPASIQHRNQAISKYLACCDHWKQIPLNPRQQQWVQEIELFVQKMNH